jgi:cytochrome c nitrite reductase small subunit
MQNIKSGKSLRFLAVAVILGGAASLFLLLGPPQLLAKSESPAFCGSCHVMEAQHAAWSRAGAHRRNQCVDCHLPNQNIAAHYIWKAIDGMKDVGFFYSGLAPEKITITNHGKKVLQANCVRCHSTTVDMISKDRQCWDCHRRLAHTRTGAIETF